MRNFTTLAALMMLSTLASSAAVDGDWNLSLTAAEGSTYFMMSIAVDGEDAKGNVGEALFSGTYMDGNLKLTGEYYVMEAGYTSKLDLDVRLDGDQLKGTAAWDVYTADVLGKRPE